MTTDLQALLDQIDRLDQEATKGPWIIDSIESGEHALFVDEDNPGYGHLGAASSTVASFLLAQNANFIAHARESIPRLAKALQAVTELHKPSELYPAVFPGVIYCVSCWDGLTDEAHEYPCPTVQALTDAMEADHAE